MWKSTENVFSRSQSFEEQEDEDDAVRWSSLERLPTHCRVRKGLFRNVTGETKEVSLGELDIQEQRIVLDRLEDSVRGDYEQLFIRMRNRFAVVGLEFPKIEIRFQNLVVESFVHVGSRALPTIPNFIMNAAEVFLRRLCVYHVRRRKIAILDNIAGSFQPSRLTLLLGPPGSGKTTLLLALAGRLRHDLQASGRILYNTQTPEEVSLQRICAYVSQQDVHIAEMTVRETLMFAGYCQHIGTNYEMISELCRREKIAGIKPEVDLDLFMKALELGTPVTSLVVEHILKILGLDICANTLVGDEMLKGISGGQKKRLTTGELLVGPSRVLLMDDISTGLDSSSTYQIVKYLKNITHALDRTTIISLLQPAPQTYELFDDVLLLCEGQIIFQGPRDSVLDFFASMGFRCPERKNVADFLQEVSSKKDQRHYWSFSDRPYEYVSVTRFAEAFQSYHNGRKLFMEPVSSVDRPSNQYTRLSAKNYSRGNFYLLRTSFYWQMLLMKRNLFIYVFKSVQLFVIALITMSVFFRARMHHNTVDDGGLYVGELYFSMVIILFNGFTEVSMLVSKLPVIYKHRELKFYPGWVYTVPSCILSIPVSFIESTVWVAVTYFVVGFDAQSTRIFQQFLLFFFLHQMSIALFRLMGSLGRNMIVSNTFGSFAMLVVMALGGYIISRDRVPDWWLWGFWISPLMYAQNAASINELHGNSWGKRIGKHRNSTLGDAVLKSRHLFADDYWYWLGIAALFGYTVLFNILFTFFLSYLNPLGGPQAIMSEEDIEARENKKSGETSVELRHHPDHHRHRGHRDSDSLNGMAIPFQRLSVSFSNICYFVDVPVEVKNEGMKDGKRLQLLANVSGAFRPGVLTALVGVSGAGKTTLMDVLSGRKTGGTVEGDVYVSGHPKKQETFARVCGYCEQNDVHSPCLTVLESLLFSAWLRLPSGIGVSTQRAFVHEVMELVELTPLSGMLVGVPGVDGLSTEQRKRLTIAVELVANPSVVFMDEPTSGLDARSAAIVMRAVRNIADTGRTIVCTIHQPSIEIVESFDEILVMKRGGKLVYAGELGTRSAALISFFEAVGGVMRFRTDCNPCAWVLEATSPAEETRLEVDFSEIYRGSELFRRNAELIEGLRRGDGRSEDLSFPSRYSRSFVEQFKACLWKQNLSYWHNPLYTAVRFFYTLVISLMLGTICWRSGSKRSSQQDVANAMGSMYVAVLFIGVTNGTSVQPVVSVERFVFYRERAAGMYSPLAFALAQIAVEFPYVLVQTLVYCVIFYSMASFEWSVEKFGWYVYFMYVSILYFTFYGMMTTAITPNHGVAAIIAAPFYMLWNLFSGFMIPYKRIPAWWRWYYWGNPVSWTLYGLLCSQYGDGDEMVELSDGSRRVPMRELMEGVYGFNTGFLPAAALAVAGFSLFFAAVFSLGIKSFNFQKR